MLASAPNWAEQMTGIGTAIGAIGLISAIGAAIFAAQQVRESRQTRQAATAVDFLRRWDEADLVESRRLVAEYGSPDELRDALLEAIRTNSADAYVMFRELDYFEQLGALERVGALDFDLVRVLLGRRLVDRWELWMPSVRAMGDDVYPAFEALAEQMRAELATQWPTRSSAVSA